MYVGFDLSQMVMRIPYRFSLLANVSIVCFQINLCIVVARDLDLIYSTTTSHIPKNLTMRKQFSLRLSGKDHSKDGEKSTSKKKLSFKEPPEVEEKSKASTNDENESAKSQPDDPPNNPESHGAVAVYPGGLKKLDSQKKPVREVTFNLERRDSDSSCCSLDDLELEVKYNRHVLPYVERL